MTLSPREAIAKFQDLFNEHYYRFIFASRFFCNPFLSLLHQPRHESPQQLDRHQAAVLLHPRSVASDMSQSICSENQAVLMCRFPPLQAMDELDNSCAFSKRLYVPPTYAELRKIINIAQVPVFAICQSFVLIWQHFPSPSTIDPTRAPHVAMRRLTPVRGASKCSHSMPTTRCFPVAAV